MPLLSLAAAALAGGTQPTVNISTPGLNIAFDRATAAPVSVTNARGEELLGAGSPGFYVRYANGTKAPFDRVAEAGANQLTFGVSASGAQVGWAFGGTSHYLTANCTFTSGFGRGDGSGDGQSVHFDLEGKETGTLQGISLNYMMSDGVSGRGQQGTGPQGVRLSYEAPWAKSKWNPLGRFGVYERGDDAAEDETLYDIWVDEGLPRPRVSGAWDRPAAKAWMQAWIKSMYDRTTLAMVPSNLSEWRQWFPLAKQADATVLWFNFRAWDYTSIDNVNPSMFPRGVQDFKDFSDDAARQGLALSTHRMSGGLDPRDPDYCVKPSSGLLAWGSMTLVGRAAASDTKIVVQPAPGLTTAAMRGRSWSYGSCSVGDEYVYFTKIRPQPGGDWEMDLKQPVRANHTAGALVRCYAKGNVYYIPDLFSDLYEEVAVRYANFSNLIGFNDGSFDGAAWFSWYGTWGANKFATLVYQNLDHPTSVHTSGLMPTPAWPEFRFNVAKAAFGGSYTLDPTGVPLEKGYPGHATPGLEEVSNLLLKGLATNSRMFQIGQDVRTDLGTFTEVGNAMEVLALVRDYKRGSLAMGSEQRQYMTDAVRGTDPRPRPSVACHGTGTCPGQPQKNVLRARWEVDGGVFRKWVNAGTAAYDTLSFQPNSYVPSRFYARTGERVPLVLSQGLQAGFDRAAVTGRVLPRFDASSPQNVDLIAKMGAGPALRLGASNPAATESWDEGRLQTYTVAPSDARLNFTSHQGIGMFVDGDGSGGTLVVRVICAPGNIARDYAVPLDFVGKRWVEVPTGEQGWRARNWGPVGVAAVVWFPINYAAVTAVAVGVGYLPPNTTSAVTVTGLQALAEVEAPLVDPRVTVGGQTVQANGTLRTYDRFTLDADGTFSVYDRDWHPISTSSVGPFRPANLTSFVMQAAAPAQPLWLEVGVSGSTETVPNPAANRTGGAAP